MPTASGLTITSPGPGGDGSGTSRTSICPTPRVTAASTASLLFSLASSLDSSQSDVVLRQGRCSRSGRADVFELRPPQAPSEAIVVWESVKHPGHPPAEVLYAPDPTQTGIGVGVEQRAVSALQVLGERLAEHLYVGDRQIQSLCPGCGDDVHRVPGQIEPPVLHRRGDEAAQRRDRLLDHRPLLQ